MKPLIVLIVSFIICILTLKLLKRKVDYKISGRIAMSIMLIFTAMGHFIFSEGMAAMIPDFIPFKEGMIIVTGVLEILFAIGLLIPKYKTFSGWLLILFFILVLPSNIKAAIEHVDYKTGLTDGPGLMYLWFRVPLQVFFIVWVYFFTIRDKKSYLK
ncbi:DoxX family protein [Aquimarina algiphila]|uniref:DoxX family protein n=1 Tax=Aquimarina algiphila TaxID=2047982 RepID=UPI0024910D5F|nr:hypothetical protein [Aquimarina algiphila]